MQLDLSDTEARKAEKFVDSLKSAKIVYRTFDTPVGNVYNMSLGQKYSIQGFFLPSIGPEYEFVNYNPVSQHYAISVNVSHLVFFVSLGQSILKDVTY